MTKQEYLYLRPLQNTGGSKDNLRPLQNTGGSKDKVRILTASDIRGLTGIPVCTETVQVTLVSERQD